MDKRHAPAFVVGKRFGQRVVLRYAGVRRGAVYRSVHRYIVQCDCGRKDIVDYNRLRAGKAQQCKLCALQTARAAKELSVSKPINDLTGQRFGKRVVIRFAGMGVLSHSNRARFVVRCDCGREDTIYGMALVAGQSRACKACASRDVRKTKKWISNSKKRS